jgi:hypothetical protein
VITEIFNCIRGLVPFPHQGYRHPNLIARHSSVLWQVAKKGREARSLLSEVGQAFSLSHLQRPVAQTSRTHRNPTFVAELSGIFEVRAATRYRLQYER